MNNEKPTLCFATMCKNEEHCIKDTLEGVYKFIDYWVVCDTGSTDRTVEIILEFFSEKKIPGELHVDEWVGFDHNKTLMMKRAKDKTDYVLHLDADDIFIGDVQLKENQLGHDAYYIPVKRGGTEFKSLLIFNNRLTWKFCGVAHTTIKCLEKTNFDMYDLSGNGYYLLAEGIGSRSFDPKKYLYDAERLQKQFFDTLLKDEDGLNNRSVFYTAQSYMDYGDHESAIKWNRLYIKLKDTWIEERFEAQMRIATSMMVLKYDLDEIIHEMNEAIKIISDRAEPYYFLGGYCNLIGEFETAYKYLKIAILQDLEQVKKKYVLFVQEHLYNTLTYDELSVACYWTGRYEEGLNYVLKIIDNPKFKDDRQRLLDNKKFFEEKLSVVEK
jgi:glycosyltransferase involved in cell wall biosynthesis